MSDKNHVRNQAIKMAFENPHLREKMLPLIKKLSGEFTEQEWKTHKQRYPGAKAEDHTITKGDGGKSKSSGPDYSDSKAVEAHSEKLADITQKKYEDGSIKMQDIYNQAVHEGLSQYEQLSQAEKNNAATAYQKHIQRAGLGMGLYTFPEIKGALDSMAVIGKDGMTDYGSEETVQNVGLVAQAMAIMIRHYGHKTLGLPKDYSVETAESRMKAEKKPAEKKPRENGELPIGDKGQQKRKQMSKADKLKAYQEAIKNSKSMSPEDKKKALEKSKKPGFDADAALGAMGEDEEEDGGKTAASKAPKAPKGMPSVKELEKGLKSLKEMKEKMDDEEEEDGGKTAKKDTTMNTLRAQVIRLAHENPELRADLLPLLQQAKVASKTASMPRKDKRPATGKSRQEWNNWFEDDLRMKLEAVGVSKREIDLAIGWITHYNYGILNIANRRLLPSSKAYRHFRTNADIYAWATGRGKLSEFTYNPNIPEIPYLQTYPTYVKHVMSQARTAGKKVASMPPANKRPAGEKSRNKWADWMKTDIQTKLEEAGCPQQAIDQTISSLVERTLRNGDGWGAKKEFYYFKTNADIHAWITGRAKLSDLPKNRNTVYKWQESYMYAIKEAITEYGSANSSALRDKAKAMMNKCKGYQVALAAHVAGGASYRSNFRYDVLNNANDITKDLEERINNGAADTLKNIIAALEWASKCPEPPKNLY